MEFQQSPFFRLPTELRHQIYFEIFFSHIRDPPLLRDGLERPQGYARCIRLWIEGEDLITHRNWLNEITVEPRTDVHAFLRTCRAACEDAGAFIYDNTAFMIFTSQKYTRMVERANAEGFHRMRYRTEPLPDSIEDRIALVGPWPVVFYNVREWPHVDNKPRWKLDWSGRCYEYVRPRTTFLGHLDSSRTSFLRRAKNVLITAYIRTPGMMHLTTTKLRNLQANLPASLAEMKTSKVWIYLNSPTGRKHVEKELWRSEPMLSPDIFDPFLAVVQSLKQSSVIRCSVHQWWKAALRKPKVVALEDACYGDGNAASSRDSKRLYPWDWELIKKWDVPWCGDCAACKAHAQRMEGLDQMPGSNVFE